MDAAPVPPLLAEAASDPSAVELRTELKSISVAGFPYDTGVEGADTDPTGSSVLDGRLRFLLPLAPRWRLEVHQEVALQVGAAAAGATGVANEAPELVGLGFRAGEATTVLGRVDRLFLQGEVGPVTVTLGRQPVSHGAGLFFTPLDLVAPFGPATVDTEYKPGVDAARVIVYGGLTFQQELVAAWVGQPWDEDDTTWADVAAASVTRLTVGVTDVSLFLGEVREDEVVGLSIVSAIGAVGLHGDATLTLPPGHLDETEPEEDPYVRVVAGTLLQPGPDTSLSVEMYHQSNGAAKAEDYLGVLFDARHARGELWAAGRWYAAASLSHQLRPTVGGSLAAIVNLQDPSAMLVPGLSVSVADNVDLGVGAWVGVGARPDGTEIRSEFGLLPVSGFVRLGVYGGGRSGAAP